MLENFENNIWQFNEIAGNNTNTSLDSFKAQQRCLIEEVNEISTGLENKDVEEVLDGVVDTLYVAIGMLHKLEEMGIDTNEAMKRIGENNLSKFPVFNREVIEKTLDVYKQKGISLTYRTYVTNDGTVVVFTDENAKVKKPFGFQSVELTDLVAGVKFNE